MKDVKHIPLHVNSYKIIFNKLELNLYFNLKNIIVIKDTSHKKYDSKPFG